VAWVSGDNLFKGGRGAGIDGFGGRRRIKKGRRELSYAALSRPWNPAAGLAREGFEACDGSAALA